MGHTLNILQNATKLRPLAPVNGIPPSEMVPRVMEEQASEAPMNPAPSLVRSPFQIDRRGEVIRELREDAAILEEQAQGLIKRAEHLRAAAQHLEEYSPNDA